MSALNDFTDLHDAIKAELARRLPQLNTVELYDPTEFSRGDRLQIDTPAVLIEMAQAKPGDRLTGGGIPWRCEFYLHCILSEKTPQLPLAVRNLGAAVAHIVAQGEAEHDAVDDFAICPPQRWGLGAQGVTPVDVNTLELFPGAFKPGKGGNDKAVGYDSAIVAFEQTVHLGAGQVTARDWQADRIEIGGGHTVGVNSWD